MNKRRRIGRENGGKEWKEIMEKEGIEKRRKRD